MKYIFVLPFLLFGCGTAKDVYYDKRMEVCEQKCNMKYGKYDRSKKSSCMNKCKKDIFD